MVEVRSSSKDATSPSWDLSQERAFIENLLGQRFDFFLVFFALVVAGTLSDSGWPSYVYAAMLAFGALICGLLALAIGRSQQKLDLILGELRKDTAHPVAVISEMAKGPSRRKLIGYTIPRLCTAFLTLAAIIAAYDAWRLACTGPTP